MDLHSMQPHTENIRRSMQWMQYAVEEVPLESP